MSYPEGESAAVAIAAALAHIPPGSDIRGLLMEQLLNAIVEDSRTSAAAVGMVLQSLEEDLPAEWGRKIMDRLQTPSKVGPTQRSDGLDILLLAIKKTELSACLRAFGVPEGTAPRQLGDVDLWELSYGGRRVGISWVGSDGNVEAAIEIIHIHSLVSFQAAVLVGMAAGLPSEFKKGDVVISSWVVAYEFARATVRRYISRAKPYAADFRSVNKVAGLHEIDNGWAARVCAEIHSIDWGAIDDDEPEKLTASWRPSYKTGVILAGSRLIEDGSLAKLRDQINDRAVAAEMEGAGFAAACASLRVPWLVVRGIADYGDADLPGTRSGAKASSSDVNRRGKSWQFPATFAAAVFVRDWIVKGQMPLIPRAR